MKKILWMGAVVLMAGSLAFTLSAELPIGSSMPMSGHKMLDISGKELSMKEATKSNGLLVMFSCNTCPYVVKNEQRTVAIGEFASKLNVGVMIINSNEDYRKTEDSYAAMKAYAAEQKYNWYYVVDENSQVADAFGAKKTPECYLFDNTLKLVYHGAIDDSPSDETAVKREHLKEAMLELTSGKPVSVTESKSVGCTIKRKAKQ